MALATSDGFCRIISPSVVLDDRLDGEDLAWVRDHLRRCEACRRRVEAFREGLLREGRLEAATPAAPDVVASTRRRASTHRGRVAPTLWYTAVALMAVLAIGLFVRFAAEAVKQAPPYSVPLATGSFEAIEPSAVPSPSATSEPSSLPATSQNGTALTVVVPSSHPAPAPAPPPPTPAPVAALPPAVILTVTPRSGLAPLTVTADASRSTSPSGIATYEFDFGDGTRTPSTRSTFTHTYCPRGIPSGAVKAYQLTVIVTDTAGRQSSASVSVEVTMPVPRVTC